MTCTEPRISLESQAEGIPEHYINTVEKRLVIVLLLSYLSRFGAGNQYGPGKQRLAGETKGLFCHRR